MRRPLYVLALLAPLAAGLWACGEEGHLFVNGPVPGDGGMYDDAGNLIGDGGDTGDGGLTDLGPDMTLTGPSCGEMVTCVLQCGLTNLSCSQGCFQGAKTDQITAAGALVLCAATNCLLGGDGGIGGLGGLGGGGGGLGGGTLELVTCMATSCQQELSDCGGLLGGLGGLGGIGGP